MGNYWLEQDKKKKSILEKASDYLDKLGKPSKRALLLELEVARIGKGRIKPQSTPKIEPGESCLDLMIAGGEIHVAVKNVTLTPVPPTTLMGEMWPELSEFPMTQDRVARKFVVEGDSPPVWNLSSFATKKNGGVFWADHGIYVLNNISFGAMTIDGHRFKLEMTGTIHRR